MNAATPMLAKTTAVVRKCELLPISFSIENICQVAESAAKKIGIPEKALTFWWHVYAKTMTGKLLNVATALSGRTTLKGPLSCIVSPFMKCATTSMTKYPIEINAIMLVYLRESKRLKNDKGMTINLGSMVS